MTKNPITQEGFEKLKQTLNKIKTIDWLQSLCDDETSRKKR